MFCDDCQEKLFHRQFCPRCRSELVNLSCPHCAKFFGLENLYIFGFYQHWKRLIIKSKRFPSTTNLPFLSILIKKCYPDFHRNIFFVPSQHQQHWLLSCLAPEHHRLYCPALIKNKNNLAQKLLNREERQLNAINLFQINDDCKMISSGIIIDDVMSTGTSLKTCCQLLKNNSQISLDGLVLCFNDYIKRSNYACR